MKTAIVTIATLLIASAAVTAQEKGDMAIGGNLIFGSGNGYSNFGIGAKFQYNIMNPLRLEGSLSHFFEKNLTTIWDVSANAHLLFSIDDKLSIYPLAGLSFMNARTAPVIVVGNTVSQTTDYGLNLGGGLDYKFSEKIVGNVEMKYRIGNDLNRFLLSIGVAYKL